jgi:hypothetical protein
MVGMLMSVLVMMAQGPRPKFSPEKFEEELRVYIIQQAGLTQQEADKFFPVYNEMRKKQHALFNRQKEAHKVKPATEEGCMKAIQERDNLEVEQKRIQQNYHNKFFDILPASKVYDILQAEDRFHRHKLKQLGGNRGKHPKKGN